MTVEIRWAILVRCQNKLLGTDRTLSVELRTCARVNETTRYPVSRQSTEVY